MAEDNEVPRAVSTQIMSWMGELKDGKWKMDEKALVKEVGLGILRTHRVSCITFNLQFHYVDSMCRRNLQHPNLYLRGGRML